MRLIRLASLVVVASSIFIAGCDRPPDSYSPPRQREPAEGYTPGPDAMLVDMSSPTADLYIVKDIYKPGDASWRWSAQNPTVKMLAVSNNLKFKADFALWDDGFKVTGPVEITYLVNNRPLDKVRYTSSGEKHFEEPIPPGSIMTDAETTLALLVDKPYISPSDHQKYGVVLVRMGLVK